MHDQQLKDYERTILRLKLEKFIYMDMLMDYHPNVNKNVVIYGAGEVGKLLSRCFERQPKAFIDVKEGIRHVYQIPVYHFRDIPNCLFDNECTVIVTPVWDFELIEKNIRKINAEVRIISVDRLLEGL